MTKDLKSDRWTCPSDRNLQLRSKLNAGWSYHTGKKVLKKDSQLTESELLEIQKVIQRSEMLERADKDRVVKLVERLENMKKNALRSGFTSSNRCAICGEHFYLLRSVPNECNFCKKVLCSKCIIDKQCADDSTITKNQSRRGSVTSLTYSPFKVIYLCRLCSEQREFLKKSGAWFRSSSLSGNNSSDSLARNHTTSSVSNLNKFWKPKEFFQYFDDNISNFSNENEFKNDSYSNYETQNGLCMNRFKSNENLSTANNSNTVSCKTNLNNNNNNNFVIKTPLSPSKKQDIFTFNSSLYNTSSNNNSPASLNSMKSSSKFMNESGIDDDAYDSPSMSSYNYYSNIINNMTNESGLNLKGEDENFKTKNSSNTSQLKISKISNGLLSVSASNISNDIPNNNTNEKTVNVKSNGSLNSKSDLIKSIRKPKIIEWCSTQISMEKDDSFVNQVKKNKSIEKQNKSSINTYSNNQSINKTCSNLSSSSKPKLSFQSVNNLAKKISNQNNGIVETNSVAASSSKAVSSASSLTASLNKLNFL